MLRMDYAEKVAASLAYSGYREEMEQDADLLRQLKAGLLVKFSNEPERLLSSHHSRTKASVRTHGFEVETETSSGPITPESNDT